MRLKSAQPSGCDLTNSRVDAACHLQSYGRLAAWSNHQPIAQIFKFCRLTQNFAMLGRVYARSKAEASAIACASAFQVDTLVAIVFGLTNNQGVVQ
jgi:hypothetical protein|tara:strand:+ start:2642 stop:2929 length:288 start_codon:yes stop_codon:yes gene_type:complete